MFSNILVPVDGSKFDTESINTAIEIASKFNSSITAVHVLHEFSLSSYSDDEDNGDEILKKVTEKAKLKDINVIEHLITGDPLRDMETIIRKSNADLIVINSCGKDSLKEEGPRNYLGSVVSRVIKTSTIPTLIIK